MRHRTGFTIVELLIVIVVIAILAAITIAGYSTINRRANNTAIISAASQYVKLVKSYVAANDSYPVSVNADMCVTAATVCKEGTTTHPVNATLDAQLATIGTVPRSVPSSSPDGSGIFLTYYSTQKMNGVSQPMRLTYFLFGLNQNCGLENVTTYSWPNYNSSTTGYTRNMTEKTQCWISIPGPPA